MFSGSNRKVDRWEKLAEGELRIFGFLQLDIVGSSNLQGSEINQQKTKGNLETFVTRILGYYGGRKLKWDGDGGAFIFLIHSPEVDYDYMVRAAIHVLVNMPFFNAMVGTLNLLDQDVKVRVSCHEGEANYHEEPGKMHGNTLNYFLKHEREIGHENAVTLTEDVYNELASRYIKNLFRLIEPHEYTLAGQPYSKNLYLVELEEIQCPKDDIFLTTALRIRRGATFNGSMGQTLLTFSSDWLRRLEELIAGLCSKNGVEVDRADVVLLTQLLFRFGGKYDGTDSHAPSGFLRAYPEYLTFHAENLQRNPPGSRILINTLNTLRRDLGENPVDYEGFLKWHETNKIPLLEVDPLVALRLKDSFELPATDVAIWHNHYALLFEPKDMESKTKLWLVHAGDEMYDRCVEYFAALREDARRIKPFPELFDKRLADNWEGFIAPLRRLRKESRFLLDILEPYKKGRILDAAAGIGCEYAFLTQQGFNVWPNEIEEPLRSVGRDYTQEQKVPWQPDQLYWQQLGEAFPAYWDAILVLGNSLCLVLDKKTREYCVRQFFEALRPGGMLVIDERNFSYILKDKQKIEKDPIANFRYTQKIMYCQSAIRGVPYGKITKNRVTFVYFPREIKDIDKAWERRVGHLNMHPFKKNELRKLLKKQRFVKIKKYSDFVEEENDEADFFTYTAIRPKE
jgi:SAM-dependent methyltransferase